VDLEAVRKGQRSWFRLRTQELADSGVRARALR
jgi:hypothetical protein